MAVKSKNLPPPARVQHEAESDDEAPEVVSKQSAQQEAEERRRVEKEARKSAAASNKRCVRLCVLLSMREWLCELIEAGDITGSGRRARRRPLRRSRRRWRRSKSSRTTSCRLSQLTTSASSRV